MIDGTLLETLAGIVGAGHVLTGSAVSERATHFWDAAPLQAGAVVRPADTAETAAVMSACHAARQSVVTHGGLTGLVNGNRTTPADIVLSLERQRAIEALDPVGRTITVQAGCVLEQVQAAASEANLQFGLDLGARGSCTIGGNIATNAGGLSVLRYGMMRAQVLGLEAVLADGTIITSMNRMLKNNAGYDLKQLFIGSEGTLGVVTRAVLRLHAATPAVETAMVAFEHYAQVTGLLAHMDRALAGSLNAFEVMWNRFYALNTNPAIHGSCSPPVDRSHAMVAIVEARGPEQEALHTLFEAALATAFDAELIVDGVIARSDAERASIWTIRENIEIALANKPVFTYDVSLPVNDMQTYVDTLQLALKRKWPDVVMHVYGHVADGNLHVLVSPCCPDDPDTQHASSDAIVYAPLAALGGSVSAEHGIGLDKKAWLTHSRNASEIELMRGLKRQLDEHNILNPGKLLNPAS